MTTEAATLEAVPAAKAPKAKKAPKANGKKAAPAAKANGLTGNEVLILTALSKAGGKPLTRDQLRSKTGIQKGWSRTLGAGTKDDGGVRGGESLEGRGYVRSDLPEGSRKLEYTLTPAGKKALDKARAN